jgi:hypothetical protein
MKELKITIVKTIRIKDERHCSIGDGKTGCDYLQYSNNVCYKLHCDLESPHMAILDREPNGTPIRIPYCKKNAKE